MEEAINSIFVAIGSVTQSIRSFIGSFAPDYMTLILLAISLVTGYYLNRKFPNFATKAMFISYGLILFLLLRFV